MPGLEVTFRKLEEYAKQHGSYELVAEGDDVTLTFVPAFPEALEKNEGDCPPRVIMRGKLIEGTIHFDNVEVEDRSGLHVKEMEDAELTYKSWLDYIEENY